MRSTLLLFERAMAVSIVTIALSLTIRPPFAIECLRRSKINRGRAILRQHLRTKELTDVSQVSMQCERDILLSYGEEIVSISSAI